MNKQEVNWKYEIGQTIKDNKKNLIVIDRKIRLKEYCDKRYNNKVRTRKEKMYKCHCNICKCDYLIIESTLSKQSSGCGVCSNQVIIKGFNDISTTHPHLIKYFLNVEDTYTHSYASNKKALIKCPDCGYEKEVIINNLSKRLFSCSMCSDSIPYGEKFIGNILKQINIQFKTQLTKSTFKWCKNYKYDFYFELNNEPFICEVNGLQHYEENTNFEMSLDEQIINDKNKKDLALSNGVKEENYIVIDCRYSKFEFIKQNILDSKLNELFDFNNIDWFKAEEFTATNLIRQACDYKNNDTQLSTTQIGIIMGGYTKPTIRKWLEKGSSLGWCLYSKDEESKRNKSKGGKKRSKRVEVYKDNIYIDTFPSTVELEKQSEELFNIKFPFRTVSAICLGNCKNIDGFTFKYENKINEIRKDLIQYGKKRNSL